MYNTPQKNFREKFIKSRSNLHSISEMPIDKGLRGVHV